ncbi:hypothetical protein ACNKHW_14415 [Shigella flexneri]
MDFKHGLLSCELLKGCDDMVGIGGSHIREQRQRTDAFAIPLVFGNDNVGKRSR